MTPFASANETPLASFRWTHRIILVKTTSAEAQPLLSTLKMAQAAIDERHVLWFLFDDQTVHTNFPQPLEKAFRPAILRHYFAEPGDSRTAVRLIGKDGGLKESAEALHLEQLFARIDSMPMRQNEMQQP